MDEMNGIVKGLWLIVECPGCHKPQVLFKHVMDNKVVNLQKTRYMTCEYCDVGFFIELKESDFEVS